MPNRSKPSRPAAVLRAFGGVVAFASAVAAIWLIVYGSDNQVRIGVLLGLWAAVIGVSCVITTRGAGEDDDLGSPRAPSPDTQLEVRRLAELELASVAAAQREFQLQLEVMLRRELEKGLREQLGALQAEVRGLRAEVLDQLGGQLRLERIETTRLIGSDLEALQAEVRRLAGVRNNQDPPTSTIPIVSAAPQWTVDESARRTHSGTPARRVDDVVDADVVDAEEDLPETTVETTVRPAVQPIVPVQQAPESMRPPTPQRAAPKPPPVRPAKPVQSPVPPVPAWSRRPAAEPAESVAAPAAVAPTVPAAPQPVPVATHSAPEPTVNPVPAVEPVQPAAKPGVLRNFPDLPAVRGLTPLPDMSTRSSSAAKNANDRGTYVGRRRAEEAARAERQAAAGAEANAQRSDNGSGNGVGTRRRDDDDDFARLLGR